MHSVYADAKPSVADANSLSVIADNFLASVKLAGELADRLSEVADRLNGPIPRAVEASAQGVASIGMPSSLVDRLKERNDSISATLARAMSELNRIERVAS